MTEEFFQKVCKIAKVKYELNEDVMEAYSEEIDQCWYNGFSPIRTVEFIAEKIF
jgi:hypothetical protein